MRRVDDNCGVAKRGELIAQDADSLVVEFPAQRCDNCSCAIGLAAKPQAITFCRTQMDASVDCSSLAPGQIVEMQISAQRLRFTTVALFGLPLLLGLLGCGAANLFGANSLQGVAALLSFCLGAQVSYSFRDQLQRSIYERLSVTPVDC